jgi:hypothetical protein
VSRRRPIQRWAPLGLALLAVPMGMAVGTNPGQNPGCRPGVSVEVPAASTPGRPQRVATSASVVCPTPEAPGGGMFGPRDKQQFGPPGVPGQDCTATVLEPMELSLTPGGQELVFWPDPAFPGTGSDTPEPQSVARVISGIDARTFFMQGGTIDFFNPFTLNGKWDASGFKCVPKDPNNPQGSFRPNCTGATIAIGCLVQQGHSIGGGPLGLGALQGGLVDLRAQMLQLVHPGQITSLPAQPFPALVNSPACFFINGADIDGQDVNQPATFELVLLGPADGTGRRVYYVFRVDLQLTGVEWSFGDGSGATESLPPACVGVSGAPLQFAHRYLRYSPTDGFPVTATETFSIHVTEYWYDSFGQPNPPLDLGDLQPIVIQPGPAPLFRKLVVQEEGVPVG